MFDESCEQRVALYVSAAWLYLSTIHFKLTYDKPCGNVGREQPENYVCQTLAPFDGVSQIVVMTLGYHHIMINNLIFTDSTDTTTSIT